MFVMGCQWILTPLLCFSLLSLPLASSIPSSPDISPVAQQISAVSDGRVGKAVGASAASAVVVVGGVFFCFRRFTALRHRRDGKDSSFRREEVEVMHGEFRHRGTPKGLIVEDTRVDVLYLRKLECGQLRNSFSKVLLHHKEEERGKIVENLVDRPPGRSKTHEEIQFQHEPSDVAIPEREAKPFLEVPPPEFQFSVSRPSPPPWPCQSHLQPPPMIPTKKTPHPPPPPPPPSPGKKIPGPPPLPLITASRKPAAPPSAPKAGGLLSSLKPPPVPRGKMSSDSRAEASTQGTSKGTDVGQMKLKPLHWDKVIATVDHSIVWDEITDGSFR